MIVFPRPDAPTTSLSLCKAALDPPAVGDQRSLGPAQPGLHYARLVVDGLTQPERKIKTQTGYKSTRVFTADWVNVMIKTDHCDIKTGRYDYLHRRDFVGQGGEISHGDLLLIEAQATIGRRLAGVPAQSRSEAAPAAFVAGKARIQVEPC